MPLIGGDGVRWRECLHKDFGAVNDRGLRLVSGRAMARANLRDFHKDLMGCWILLRLLHSAEPIAGTPGAGFANAPKLAKHEHAAVKGTGAASNDEGLRCASRVMPLRGGVLTPVRVSGGLQNERGSSPKCEQVHGDKLLQFGECHLES